MRERSLLQLFLGLNLALAGAFVVYLLLSTPHGPKAATTSFPRTELPNLAVATSPALTKSPVAVVQKSSSVTAAAAAAPSDKKPSGPAKRYTWKDMPGSDYPAYIDRLRAAGCPEDRIRAIILADVEDLFAQKRLEAAVAHDPEWWRAEPHTMTLQALQTLGQAYAEERQALLEQLFGTQAISAERNEEPFWSTVPLTGPVLGAVSPQVHHDLQEICSRAMERQESYRVEQMGANQLENPVELAKLREQTRRDLEQLLEPTAVAEFLLRYSYNASALRSELRGIDPTPEEFRKVFHVVDPIDHQMQLDYGSVEALSPRQRERYESQREAGIKQALPPARFAAYLAGRDPLSQQAQLR